MKTDKEVKNQIKSLQKSMKEAQKDRDNTADSWEKKDAISHINYCSAAIATLQWCLGKKYKL